MLKRRPTHCYSLFKPLWNRFLSILPGKNNDRKIKSYDKIHKSFYIYWNSPAYEIVFYSNHFSSIHRECLLLNDFHSIYSLLCGYCEGSMSYVKHILALCTKKRHSKEFSNIFPNEICTQIFRNNRTIFNLLPKESVLDAYIVNRTIIA